MSELGLKPHQIGILQLLAADGKMAQARLGERLGVDKAAMVHNLNGLESIKAIQRKPHPDDGRAFIVHILPNGMKLLRRAEVKNELLSNEVFGSLSDSEQKVLHELLLKVLNTGARSSIVSGDRLGSDLPTTGRS